MHYWSEVITTFCKTDNRIISMYVQKEDVIRHFEKITFLELP